ncbi:MAG: methionyl-tRNA formyltransferase [Candidatus Aceula meridiana]|nr:methionyl-tRNA formyltransferase [Candidatus Aceula meridiana]
MNIVFFGSDNCAAANLENLIEFKHKVLACVTQPDKPKGRFLHLMAPLTKQVALKHEVEVLQPTNLADEKFIAKLSSYSADLFVVISYGRILTNEILSIPKKFSINVHASHLPQYRGAAPINWAIINGEKETGVTIIKVSPQLDAGDIILQEKISINKKDDAISLKEKIIKRSLPLLLTAIGQIEKGAYQTVAQDSKKVNYAAKLTKEDGLIDWRKKAEEIDSLVRGLVPWPGAYTHYKGKMLKILETEVVEVEENVFPGHIGSISKEGLIIGTSSKAILVKKVHLEASRAMDAASFVAGHKIEAGFSFLNT